MFLRYCFAICAIAVPLATAGYPHYQPSAYHGNGYDELVNAATGGSQHAAQAITKTAEIQPTAAEAANLGHAQAQLEALQANPTYQNLQNSETIGETIAQGNLASNIRQGRVGIVAPNQANQALYRSMLVPAGPNNHNVIATQPLPPIVVNQPGAPPQQISSGPPAVVKAAPVIYKIKPSVIYQQEVINKVPTPLSLNPVYVKVYKPGKKIDAPAAPVVQPQYHQYSAPQYHNSYPAPSSYADAPADSYAHPTQYAPQPAHYAPQPAHYAPQYQPQAAY